MLRKVGLKRSSMVGGMENFERWYFEAWHAYHRKREAIQMLYYDVFKWANRFAPFDLLQGNLRRALDVGCAHGYMVELLEGLGYDAYGCDISRLYINYSKKITNNLVLCDAQKLPFCRESFDLITCFEVLEHLHNPINFLRDCFYSLLPGGVLILQTPSGIPMIDTLISRIYSRAVIKIGDVEHHVSVYVRRGDLKNLLKLCGFKPYIERWFLLPLNPTLFNRYFPTRLPIAVPTFRAIAVKD